MPWIDWRQFLFRAEFPGVGSNLRVVSIVGKSTKSMGEAFPSALKRLVENTIIGENSTGKASMETVLELKNGHSVKFTIGKLYTSDNQTWEGSGVQPDIILPSDTEAREGQDYQLEIAKKLLMAK